jgi:hypothetical protein
MVLAYWHVGREIVESNEHKHLFAAKYVTYLPSVEELERELERDRRIAEAIVETPCAVMPSSRAKGARGDDGSAAGSRSRKHRAPAARRR